MNRLTIFSIVIVVIVALAAGGNRITGGILDAQLAPLLTRVLGLPVQLAPMKANLLQLKASSPKLIMGEPGKPSVVATDLVVSLSLPHLLEGEIRLDYASANDLMVNPWRWPSSGNPLPEDYQFLDPWLPNSLEFETGSYMSEDDKPYPLEKLRWKRKLDGGVSVQWQESRGAADIALHADLKSLQDLLLLAPIDIAGTVEVAGQEDSAIALKTTVQPDPEVAYKLLAEVAANGIKAHITATGASPWTLPDQSQTAIDHLEVKEALALLSSYNNSGEEKNTEAFLKSVLPHLKLPDHQGEVRIDEIRLGDEIGKDTSFVFVSSARGLQVNKLSSEGPTGILTGELGITSDAAGWDIKIDAIMRAREGDAGILAQNSTAQWLWREGKADLDGKGGTWVELLNSLHGDVSLAGHYGDKGDTPVRIDAQLDNEAGIFALDHMSIKLGEAHLTGSAALSGEEQRKLTLDLTGERMDLDFLFGGEDTEALPGMAIPSYLDIFPEWELDVKLDFTDLNGPNLSLARASATLQRNDMGGKLEAKATGTTSGALDLVLEASTPPGETGAFHLKANFTRLDVPDMFEQPVLLHSRSSGTLTFEAAGNEIEEIFQAMKGRADLSVEVRADNDWQRPLESEETLDLAGDSEFVINNGRITGIKIENLDIGSIEQDLDGSFSMVAGRSPWLVANLTSEALNINGLIELLPKSSEAADDADLLRSLRKMGAASIALDVDSLTIGDTPLSSMNLKMQSDTNKVAIKQLDFTTHGSQLKSEGSIIWKGERAELQSAIALSNVDLDQFLIQNPDFEHIPISGTAKLQSEGSKVAELLGNIKGNIDLQASTPQQSGSRKSRRHLTMHAKRIPNGVQADISAFQWGESEVAGSISFRNTSPPTLDVDLHSGTLSLLPWENAPEAPAKVTSKDKNGNNLANVARTSAGFVGKALLSPVRFFTGTEVTEDKERLFSAKPLQLDSLKNLEMNIKGQMDSLVSTVITAKDLTITGKLKDGRLDLQTTVENLNRGKADIDLSLNATAVPAELKFTSHFENLRGLTSRNTYSRSGLASFESRGNSTAELAAGVSGLFYLKLGPGPFDYMNDSLLTADISSRIFRALIPGIEKQEPTLECGITVGVFKDGVGVTPYGFAARTNQANLLGRIELDLAKEKIQLNFSSRSREGVGLSVGNVFSNTIQVRGPITRPRVVPKTSAIAWRGWAAFMTAGLSVVGESVLMRALASDNPCNSIHKVISKELCKENPIAASSPMVCPQGQATAKAG